MGYIIDGTLPIPPSLPQSTGNGGDYAGEKKRSLVVDIRDARELFALTASSENFPVCFLGIF